MNQNNSIQVSNLSPEKKDRLRRALMHCDMELLEDLDEFTIFLNEILHGPYSVMTIDGRQRLLHIKALVSRINGLRIEIYPNEHPPPHFHVTSAEVDASFRIDDCALITGKISRRDLDMIQVWHAGSKRKLVEKWDEMRPTKCSVGAFRSS
jgi:hypothetical protein